MAKIEHDFTEKELDFISDILGEIEEFWRLTDEDRLMKEELWTIFYEAWKEERNGKKK